MSRVPHALAVLLVVGCAVDDAGLGTSRSDGAIDGEDGGMVVRDAEPTDSFVPPTDSGPEPDLFVIPPDMCAPVAEVCNGADDDCNGMIDDGLSSVACDGDGDGCMDGLSGCSGGMTTCTDAAPRAGDACDGPDPDTMADGRLTCSGGVLVCEGDCTPSTETCDRADEDCDGLIDEDGACDVDDVTCTSRVNAGRVYQFCNVAGGGFSYDEALSYCEARGYDLVRISNGGEQTFLAMHLGGQSWWTRAHVHSDDPEDRRDRWRWHWAGGDDIDDAFWGGGEPSGNGSCGQMRSTDGLLDDRSCSDELSFVCEEAVVAP